MEGGIYGTEPGVPPPMEKSESPGPYLDMSDTAVGVTGGVQILGKRVPAKAVGCALLCTLAGFFCGWLSHGDSAPPSVPPVPAPTSPGPPPTPHTGANQHTPTVSPGSPTLAAQIATITATTTHKPWSNTANDVFASVGGSLGSSNEIVFGHGFDARSTYTAAIAVLEDIVGAADRVNVRVEGNDAVHLGEITCSFGGTRYTWIKPKWLDGDQLWDNANITTNFDYLFSAASTHLGDSGSHTITVRAYDGNWASVNTTAQRVVTLYGSNGHVGPLVLALPSSGPMVESIFQVPDVGNIEAVRVLNNGPGAWQLDSLELVTTTEMSWSSPQYLVEHQSTLAGASFWTYYSEDAVRATAPGEVMTMLEMYVSSVGGAATHESISVVLQSAQGNTPSMLVKSDGLAARETFKKPLYHSLRGPLTGLTLTITGNDGVHLDEVRVVTGNTEVLWLFDSHNSYRHNGWLDGDGASHGVINLVTQDASLNVPLAGSTTIDMEFRTVTAQEAIAGTAAEDIELVIFGSDGHYGPITLPFHNYAAGGEHSSTVPIPVPIGNFTAVKIYNTGHDGWLLEDLEVHVSGDDRLLWSYGQFLDGSGSGPESPSSDIFYASDAVHIGTSPPMAATVVTLETGSLRNAQTRDTVGVYLMFQGGAVSPAVNTTGSIHARTLTQLVIQHEPHWLLDAVVVKVFGNDGVHFSEIRVEYGLGRSSQFGTEYSWLLSELTGWLDGQAGAIYGVPDHRMYQVHHSSPVLHESAAVGSRRVTIRSHTSSGSTGYGSRSTFLVSFWYEFGHVPPQVLGRSFNAGQDDRFDFDMPAHGGNLIGVKILCTGNDGWKVDSLSIAAGGPAVQYDYNGWIDGDGNGPSSPKSEIFYLDGTWASQGTLSTAEVQQECGVPYQQCLATNTTSHCMVDLQQALSHWGRQAPPRSSPQITAVLDCMQAKLRADSVWAPGVPPVSTTG
jgi:hypothetical protein